MKGRGAMPHGSVTPQPPRSVSATNILSHITQHPLRQHMCARHAGQEFVLRRLVFKCSVSVSLTMFVVHELYFILAALKASSTPQRLSF